MIGGDKRGSEKQIDREIEREKERSTGGDKAREEMNYNCAFKMRLLQKCTCMYNIPPRKDKVIDNHSWHIFIWSPLKCLFSNST